jgi:Tfp pilus assembly protein PilO
VVLWVIAAVALAVAAWAFAWVRRLARRLDLLTQSYWELRYDYTRLRSQVARIDPGEAQEAEIPPAPAAPSVSFVPLASIRKKER